MTSREGGPTIELAPGVEFHESSGTLFLTPIVIGSYAQPPDHGGGEAELVLWAFRSFMKTGYADSLRFVVIVPKR